MVVCGPTRLMNYQAYSEIYCYVAVLLIPSSPTIILAQWLKLMDGSLRDVLGKIVGRKKASLL